MMVYLLAAAIVLVDQYTKHVVRANLALNQGWSPFPWLMPFARILHIENTGAAFGMFKEAGTLFTVMAVVVSAVIIYYARRLPAGQRWIRIALGMQLGGALGNLIDRLVFGTVTDFVSLGSFAIFNVADASISLGVTLLAVLMWLESRADRKRERASAALPPVDMGEAS